MLESEYDWRKTLATYSWAYEYSKRSQRASSRESRFGVKMTLVSKRNMQTARAIFRARLNFLGQRIILAEIRIRRFALAWMSLPSVDTSVTVFNIRPDEAPIFQACRDGDFCRIRYLLETRQASICDVQHTRREGLLEVSDKKPHCWHF